MKAIGPALLILLSLAVPANAQKLADGPVYSAGNEKYLSFDVSVKCNDIEPETRCLSGQELVWQKEEIKRWESAIRKSADMLPEEFFKKTGDVGWNFFIDRNNWATASAGYPISINILSNYKNPPEWMRWEPLRKNGLTETEMMFVALHEMGHLLPDEIKNFGLSYYNQYQGISWWNDGHVESVSALYCSNNPRGDFQAVSGQVDYRGTTFKVGKKNKSCFAVPSFGMGRMFSFEESETTLYGQERGLEEGFAETFALYIMWPEYLKQNFPKHYEGIKKLLVREYESVYPMPSSIKSRLTVK